MKDEAMADVGGHEASERRSLDFHCVFCGSSRFPARDFWRNTECLDCGAANAWCNYRAPICLERLRTECYWAWARWWIHRDRAHWGSSLSVKIAHAKEVDGLWRPAAALRKAVELVGARRIQAPDSHNQVCKFSRKGMNGAKLYSAANGRGPQTSAPYHHRNPGSTSPENKWGGLDGENLVLGRKF